MKPFKTKLVLSFFVTIQTNITIIKINTINIINIEKNAPKVPLYNVKTFETFSSKINSFAIPITQYQIVNKKVPHTKN